MRRPALAVLAFLGLSAFGPPPSDPAGPSPLTRVAGDRQDHSWQPPAYGQQTLPDAQPVTPTPLGSRATCVPSRQEVSQGPCVPAANGWGPGTRFTYFMDGCGGTFQESASCYTACPGSPWEYQAPSACVPSNGNMGPGTITSYQSNSCGAFWTTSAGCCAEGDQVTSESACVPNSGQYGPGRVTKVHNNGCGRQWDEHVACEVPAPPQGDEIVFCIDFESYSVRPMPFDYIGEQNADPNRVYGSPYALRWDNRHSCIYRFPSLPAGTYANGSPWFCPAWGHPSPSTGYCYMENPRYADFARMNAGERALRASIGEEGAWASNWNGQQGWFGRGTIQYSDAQIEQYKAWGRWYDTGLDQSFPGRVQRAY